MLGSSLVLSLAAATLQVAHALSTSGSPQYSPFGKHGGVATEVRTRDSRSVSFTFNFLSRRQVEECSEIGINLLIQGGSAVDAVSFWVTTPWGCGS